MRKKIFANWGLKLISLVLAFGLWIVVVVIGNPPDTKDFTNIPVTLINESSLTDKGKVYEILDGSNVVKRVTVKAPKDVISKITESDIIATADVSKLTNMDTIQVDLTINKVANNNYEIMPGNENTVVKLSVEDRKSVNVQLRVNTIGEVAEGYQLDYAKADENRINIWGGESKINQVSYAAVNVDISDLSSELSISETIRLYDEEDNLIEDASIHKKVETARVKVGVLVTKEVPVKYTVIGIPESGYRATGVVESKPNKVKIAGSASAINSIKEITIPEELLDLSGKKENLVVKFNIEDYLPEGIQLAEGNFNGEMTVVAYVEQEQHKKLNIPLNNIQVINLPQGYTMEIVDESNIYELQVTGFADEISLLTEAAVLGTVDVQAWMKTQSITDLPSGVYQLPVSFELGEGVVIDQPVRMRINFVKPEAEVTTNN